MLRQSSALLRHCFGIASAKFRMASAKFRIASAKFRIASALLRHFIVKTAFFVQFYVKNSKKSLIFRDFFFFLGKILFFICNNKVFYLCLNVFNKVFKLFNF